MNVNVSPNTLQSRDYHTVEEHTTTNLNAESLWPFIGGQAELHGVSIAGSLATLKSHLKQDKQRAEKRGRTRILNCRIYTLDDEANGFAMFNPAFDSEGNFGFYMEDVFVAEEARGKGLGKAIWSFVSKTAFREGASFIKWVTDARNINMMDFAEKKLKAARADEENLDATSLLTCDANLDQAYLDKYDTRKITLYDASELKQLGINVRQAEFLAKKSSDDMPLVGFITREKDAPNTVVSATFAYLNYSTFKTSWGMNIEPIVFRPNASDEDRIAILHSTIDAVRKFKIPQLEFNEYANGSTPPAPSIEFAKWHSGRGTVETQALRSQFNLKSDSMADSEDSKLVLYIMKEDAMDMARRFQP